MFHQEVPAKILHTISPLIPSLTISRVVDGSDSYVMRMQLHLHLGRGKSEDPQGPVTVSCSHTRTVFIRRRAPAHTATALMRKKNRRGLFTESTYVMACSEWCIY